jgi:hypothetical protein
MKRSFTATLIVLSATASFVRHSVKRLSVQNQLSASRRRGRSWSIESAGRATRASGLDFGFASPWVSEQFSCFRPKFLGRS